MSWNELTVALEAARTHIPEYEIAFRLIVAALFGAAIGYEREMRDRPAGLRTHMLTSLAAALFTVLTFEIFHQIRALEDPVNVDPVRVIEAVTAGVAFLAAGSIIHGQGKVEGLTTGAGMWMAGAIGVACGGGYYSVATIAVVLALVVINLIHRWEARVLETKERHAEGDRGEG